jgi:hypothetical protein
MIVEKRFLISLRSLVGGLGERGANTRISSKLLLIRHLFFPLALFWYEHQNPFSGRFLISEYSGRSRQGQRVSFRLASISPWPRVSERIGMRVFFPFSLA